MLRSRTERHSVEVAYEPSYDQIHVDIVGYPRDLEPAELEALVNRGIVRELLAHERSG